MTRDALPTRLYRLAARLLPAGFRHAHADELVAVFDALRRRAVARRGWAGGWLQLARELPGLAAIAATHRGVPAPQAAVPRASTMDAILRDLRHAARGLARDPLHVTLCALTLALGVGGTAAMAGVLRSVVLDPLPYAAPERIVRVLEVRAGEAPWEGTSVPNFLDWAARSRTLAQLALVQPDRTVNLTGRDEPLRARAALVSRAAFDLLGVRPLMGRTLGGDDFAPGAPPRVLLGERLWRRELGGDPAIVGRTIGVNGRPVEVVGVMPDALGFPDAATRLWLPLAIAPGAGYATPNGRWARLFRAYARLAPGASLDAARGEMRALAATLAVENPGPNARMSVVLETLQEHVVGGAAHALWLLFGASGLVLAIAWVNVTHLTLARLTGRAHDVAVRLAHGARRRDLARQLASESLLVAALGAALGLAAAAMAIRLLVAHGPDALPRLAEVRLDGAVLGGTVALSALLALSLGVGPAWLGSRPAFGAWGLTLGGAGRRTDGRGVGRLRAGLVVSEIAVAVVLLVGGALLLTSYRRLLAVRPGFAASGLVTMTVGPRGAAYLRPGAREALYDRLLARVRTLPGVASAGAIEAAPLAGDGTGWTFLVDGAPRPRAGEEPYVTTHVVDGAYFRTMAIPLLAGRAPSVDDTSATHEGVVVNATFVRRHLAGRPPVGARVALGGVGSPGPWLTIVGVVGDVRGAALSAEPEAELYRHMGPQPGVGDMTLVVRTTGAPAALLPAIRSALREIDRDVPIADVRTMDAVVAASVARERLQTGLATAYAALALVMAAVGIFGVLARMVGRRMRAMAVRIAVGARAEDVARHVLRHGLTLASSGIAIGLAAALALGRFVSALLFGVTPHDPMVLGTVALGFLAVAAVACWLPARRAARADPIALLRAD